MTTSKIQLYIPTATSIPQISIRIFSFFSFIEKQDLSLTLTNRNSFAASHLLYPLPSVPTAEFEESLFRTYEKDFQEAEDAKAERRKYLDSKRKMREEEEREREIGKEKERRREEEERERRRRREEEDRVRERERLKREFEERKRAEEEEARSQQSNHTEKWLSLSLYTDAQRIRASPHLRSLFVTLIPLMMTSAVSPRVAGQAVVLLGEEEKRFAMFRYLCEMQVREGVALCVAQSPSVPLSMEEGVSLAFALTSLKEKYFHVDVEVGSSLTSGFVYETYFHPLHLPFLSFFTFFTE